MKTALVYNPNIKNYSFGESHPFTSTRFKDFLVFTKKHVPLWEEVFEQIRPKPATEKDLQLVHKPEYIKVMKRASQGIVLPNILHYTTPDNLDPSTGYLPRGIHEAGKIAVGTSLEAAELVFKGKFKKAIALGGGLHHAKPNKGEGFCVYNDVAVCAKKLLQKGVKKILILDTDAHAGNGTAEIFYEEDRVLLIDFHQDPSTLYPGTGFPNQTGKGKGEGFTINIALPPGAGDKSYQYSFKKITVPVAKEFQPEIIIRNGGSDPYIADGLTNLALSMKGLNMIGRKIGALAEDLCDGKEVDLIASGYNQEVLPQAWLSLVSGLINLDLDLKEPKGTVFPDETKLKETREVIEELKARLRSHWKCLG